MRVRVCVGVFECVCVWPSVCALQPPTPALVSGNIIDFEATYYQVLLTVKEVKRRYGDKVETQLEQSDAIAIRSAIRSTRPETQSPRVECCHLPCQRA